MIVVDHTLQTLIDLDGFIAEIGDGYWVKIEAKKIQMNFNKPFGVKYSLTLHNPQGSRVLGFDNAHAAPRSFSKEPHDHLHKGERIVRYNYKDAGKLLTDFWDDSKRRPK